MDISPIAHIETDFPTKFGVPRQSGLVPELKARIIFEPPYRDANALRGLDGFDYIWVIWHFSANEASPLPPPKEGEIRQMADTIDYSLLKENAKRMKYNPTDAESVLWCYLRDKQLGHKFRRQHIIGQYIVDFVCISKNIIIEVDGGYHLNEEQRLKDKEREDELSRMGYKTLRFLNEEVILDTENVVKKIVHALSTPSLGGGRGEAPFRALVRPPRLGGNDTMGVFATRSSFRPNGLALSSLKIERIEPDTPEGPIIHVLGADLMDGTPIYDIKPYITFTDSHPEARSGFVDTHAKPTLTVDFPYHLLSLLPTDKQSAAIAMLEQDPRPSYQDDPERIYGVPFAGFDIRFRVSENFKATVTQVVPL